MVPKLGLRRLGPILPRGTGNEAFRSVNEDRPRWLRTAPTREASSQQNHQEFFFERRSLSSLSMVRLWTLRRSFAWIRDATSEPETSASRMSCSLTKLTTSGVSLEAPFGPGFLETSAALPCFENFSQRL